MADDRESVGAWVMLSMAYTYIFYYTSTFFRIDIFFTKLVILFESILINYIKIHPKIHFSFNMEF